MDFIRADALVVSIVYVRASTITFAISDPLPALFKIILLA